MKKLFTILCATLLSVGVFAQAATEAGTFLLSGTTGFDFGSLSVTGTDPSDAWDDDNSQKSSIMELDLMGGYFVMDGLAVGLAVNYKSESTTEEYETTGFSSLDKETESTMVIAPTLRYYFGETGVWLQTAYGFGSMSSEYESESTGSPTVTVEASNPMSILTIGAGYAISLADNISLNPSVGYAMSSVTIEDGYMNTNGNLEDLKIKMSGMLFKIGVSLHLGN
jgi:hypothetical protein